MVVSDQSQLRSLREWLRQVPGVEVTQIPGKPNNHEQGVWDVLQMAAAGGGVLAVAIRTLPEFLKSRRSDLKITVTTPDEEDITVEATNVDQVLPILERLLDGQRPRP